MPPNQRQVGYREQRWQPRQTFGNLSEHQLVTASSSETNINRAASRIIENTDKAHLPSGTLKHRSVLPPNANKRVWKAKSDGVVKSVMVAEATNAAPEVLVARTEADPSGNSGPGLSNGSKNSSAATSTVRNTSSSGAQVRIGAFPVSESEKFNKEKRGAYKAKTWQKKLHSAKLQNATAATIETEIRKVGVLAVAEDNDQAHVSPLPLNCTNVVSRNTSMLSQRAIWKPKFDGTVSGSVAVEVSNISEDNEQAHVSPLPLNCMNSVSRNPSMLSQRAICKPEFDGTASGSVVAEVSDASGNEVDYLENEPEAAVFENNEPGLSNLYNDSSSLANGTTMSSSEALDRKENVTETASNENGGPGLSKLVDDSAQLVNDSITAEVKKFAAEAVHSQGYLADPPILESTSIGFDELGNEPRSLHHSLKANITSSCAEIRAAFYPKYRNEMSDHEIRTRMIDMVSSGLVILEVTLKHSGVLFTYAGHKGGAYVKNSFGNIYTAVGVFVLAREFCKSWGSEAREKQEEFNEALERDHLCISMELVTAVLGDQGQRPQEDYVVVTAVTKLDCGKPLFYSTPDVIAFCQKWRLPTTNLWLFSSRKSITTFFAAYDALLEEGTATSVCEVLDKISDLSMPGFENYIKVQGEILEGLVARVVSPEMLPHMQKVLKESYHLSTDGFHLGPTLREVCSENKTDGWQQMKALLNCVGNSFCPDSSDWFETEIYDEYARKADQSAILKFLNAHPIDYCTAKLQEMISLMRESRYPVNLQCYHNFAKVVSSSDDKLYLKMAIHAYSDSAFHRYSREMRYKTGLWPFYRGIFFDVTIYKESKDTSLNCAKTSNGSVQEVGNSNYGGSERAGAADENADLMIKLQFLPFRLRTTLMRDGLPIIYNEGRAAYKTYYLWKMKTWGISCKKQCDLGKMLDEWAFYVKGKYVRRLLSPSTYLTEAEPFLKQYAERCVENMALIGSAGNSVTSEDFFAVVEDETDVEPAGNAVTVEDFMSIVEDGTHEINCLKQDSGTSISASSVKTDAPRKEGLIVFFPGIPGSAKSGICREIDNQELGDGRRVSCLRGDYVRGIGKRYWPEVADRLKKYPYSVIVADKNAPNEEVWQQIEKICRYTRASAIPIIPDSKGTNSNPYCLDTLAVSMDRVFEREYHTGNLDKASLKAGYVLLKFYHIHEGKNRKEFERELVQRFGSFINMPFFKSKRSPMPEDLRSILEEGIYLYKLHRKKYQSLESLHGLFAKDWAVWEKKLKKVIADSSAYLSSIQVQFETKVKQVLKQLRTIATGEHTTLHTVKKKFGGIAFAAISLPATDILSLLQSLAENHPGVEAILRDEHMVKGVLAPYVTLAHKRSHGIVAVASYAQLLHQQVSVSVTGLLFSEKMAALEACIGSTVDGEKIISEEKWPHVTLWPVGVEDSEANDLLRLVSEEKATRIDIDPPLGISGTLEFY